MEQNRLKKKLFMFTVLLLGLLNLEAEEDSRNFKVYSNDSKVYSAVLEHGLPNQSTKILVLEESISDSLTSFDEKLGEKISAEAGISKSCFEDWVLVNKESTNIKFKISSALDISFLSSNKLDRLFSEDTANQNWAKFKNLYQDYDGFIAISKIGYNQHQDQALLLVEHHCGPDCGTGKFVTLTKTGHIWEVRSTMTIWLAY